MHQSIRYVGIYLSLSATFVACGAVENLGPPPDVNAADGSISDASPTETSLPEAALPDAGTSDDGPGPSDATIEAGSFSLTLTPGSATILRGGSTQVVVTVLPAPFPTDVTVAVTGLPTGVTADPLVMAPGQSSGVLTFHATASAAEIVGAALTVSASLGTIAGPTAPLSLLVRGAPGTLDLTFGTNGVVALPFYEVNVLGPSWQWPTPLLAAIVLQPDGKIVYGGHGYTNNAPVYDNWPLILGRLNSDGTVDTTFNATGQNPGRIVQMPPGYGNFVPSPQAAVQLTPSGDIAFGGYASIPGDPPSMLLAMFTPSGAPEMNFAGTGYVVLSWNHPSIFPGGFLVQPNGSMILAGELGSSEPALTRVLPTGAPDTSIDPPQDGGIGLVSYPSYPGAHFGPLVALGNGDLLAGLAPDDPATKTPPPLAIALSADKVALDSKFGSAGALADAAFVGWPARIGVAADGSVVLLGSTASTIELAHFVDGTLDTGFGGTGLAAPAFTGGNASAGSIAFEPTGQIVVGATLPGAAAVGVVRFTAAGELDLAFAGGAGFTGFAPMNGSSTFGPTQVAVDPLGRVLVGTIAGIPSSSVYGAPALQLARYWP